MFQSIVNPERKFGSVFRQRRYDSEHEKDKAKIYCIRHGQTALDDLHRSDGWLDLPLNDEGRKNVVLALDKHLKYIPITHIYTSPLRRTKETAEIIKSGMTSDPSVTVVPDIKTWNLGSLAGSKKETKRKVVKDLLENTAKSAPDGESYDEFKDRFDSWLKEAERDAKKDGPFLLVLSGSNCRCVSEMLFDDRNILDMDEAGIFVIYEKADGTWTAKEIQGQRSEKEREDSPEAS